MGEFLRLADIDELAEGEMKKYRVQDKDILVTKTGGKYYAVQNKCPHLGGDLSRGKLEGNIVTCPRHGSQFNLVDGSTVRWMKGEGLISKIGKFLKSPRPLETYNIKLEGRDIMLET